MVYVIRTSKPSIHMISISMWVFTYPMEYLHHHNYKLNSRHRTWTSHMAMILYTINLVQMKTSAARTLRHSLLATPPQIKPPPKTKFTNWKVQPLPMWMDFIFPLTWMLGVTFFMDEMTMHCKGHHADKIRTT